MASAITNSTLESSAYENIFSMLDDRDIISDPRDTSGTSHRKFIYDSDPLMKGLNFGDFPYIVAELPLIEYSKVSVDGKTKDIKWTVSLTVRTARDGANQRVASTGRTDILSIGDELNELFNSTTHRQTLADNRIYFTVLTKDNTSTPVIDEKYLYQSDYTLTFMERIQVST